MGLRACILADQHFHPLDERETVIVNGVPIRIVAVWPKDDRWLWRVGLDAGERPTAVAAMERAEVAAGQQLEWHTVNWREYVGYRKEQHG
jgi:hypothetical protein